MTSRLKTVQVTRNRLDPTFFLQTFEWTGIVIHGNMENFTIVTIRPRYQDTINHTVTDHKNI